MKRFIARGVFVALFVALVLFVRSGGPVTDTTAPIARIVYEIFALDRDGNPMLLSRGERGYPLSDIFGAIRLERLFQASWFEQGVMITSEFSMGAYIFPEGEVTGFALWMRRHPPWYEMWSTNGFSWEWFRRENGSVFRKLQGSGRVHASFATRNDKQELAVIEFVEDAEFRLNAPPLWRYFEVDETHMLLVRSGSTLRLAP